MPRIARHLILAVIVWATCAAASSAAAPEKSSAQGLPSIATKTKGTQRFEGFLPLYWNSDEGRLYLEIPKPEMSLLYLTTLTQGLGSNDVGLDRGQVSDAKLVRFERIGPKVLLVQPNLGFRAVSDSVDERRAVEQSFAESVLFGFTVVAVEGERVLVDASDFAVRDGHGAIASIVEAKQGSYTFDKERSAVYLPGTKAFPRNTEIEATVTLAGEGSGQFVKDVTPTPQA
ncbi:DUF5117 domain-containing protein, partial [uncultured Nevskia sp.]|uniref:DUF5117 domain-containing protein n=1 Tax=uncultured Nevskia sp. TaxID=228950 RepID=UPI0025D81CA7